MSENSSSSQRWGAPLPFKDDETLAARRRRSLAGALYGFLGGCAFALFSGLIDVLTFPDLPIYTDWATILTRLAWLAPALATIGAFGGWFTESLRGIGFSALTLSITALGVSVYQSKLQGTVANLLMLLVMAMPVAAICIPVALALRGLTDRHIHALRSPQPARGIAVLVLVALLLGMFPAIFTRMSSRAERSARLVHGLLTESGSSSQHFPAASLPGMAGHSGMAHRLNARSSSLSTVGYDVYVIYPDGYAITCIVVAYGDSEPYLRACLEK